MNKNYKEIEFFAGSNIERAVKELLIYKEKGILACGDFNGTTLYSDTVTLDEAYISITGKTKAQLDKEHQEWKENYEREERKFKESIPSLSKEWMEKGREILTEDKWEYWDEVVPIRLGDLYHGMELGCCLDIVKILNNDDPLIIAKAMIESQNHSGVSYGLVCAMVKEFCDRGQEFVDYIK
jgi:hypothetical protein